MRLIWTLQPFFRLVIVTIAEPGVFELCSASFRSLAVDPVLTPGPGLPRLSKGVFLGKWWAWQGLNLRPLRCQHGQLTQNCQFLASAIRELANPSLVNLFFQIASGSI